MRRVSTILVAVAAATGALVAQRIASSSTIPTERIFAAVGLREGVAVGEIGAGDGELSVMAAKVVGANGRVYTSELGDERVRALEAAASASGLSHITVVTGDPNETNFPDGCCQAIFMRNVYHHFDDPAAMNASIVRSLQPGGRLAVVDFSPSGGREAERAAARDEDGTHGVSAESVARELRAAGLDVLETERSTDRWFMVVARRPDTGPR